jgi:hypothetical protein
MFRQKPQDYKTAETPKKREDPYAVVTGVYLNRNWFFPYRYDVRIYDEIRGPQSEKYNHYSETTVKQYQVDTCNAYFISERRAKRWAKRHLAWYLRGVQHKNLKLIVEQK